MRRDPFARTQLTRKCVSNLDPSNRLVGACTWCGQKPKRLYRYGTESDGGTFYGWAKGLFCNLGCFDSYHN